MAKNNSETLLRGANAATYGDVNGITFYKLQSKFSGDTTKDCSLTGEEVDRNFYFLRGYDIESVTYENGLLTIQRVDHDYAPIEIELGLTPGSGSSSDCCDELSAEIEELSNDVNELKSQTSEFLKDTYVCGVTINANNDLVITRNDGATFTVHLGGGTPGGGGEGGDYDIADDSTTFLKIKNYHIGAYVDGGGGYRNTLASTDYVGSAETRAVQNANNYTDDKLRIFSAHVINHIDTVDNQLYQEILKNRGDIETLNGTYKDNGSVVFTFYRELDDALLAGDVINPQGITENDSLIKKIHVDNDNGDLARYYVSNKASDMTIIVDGESRNLDAYINGLNNQIANLQNRINELEGGIEQTIKNTIKRYLVGTDYEIKITETLDDRLKVGFTDDAVFGDPAGINPVNH